MKWAVHLELSGICLHAIIGTVIPVLVAEESSHQTNAFGISSRGRERPSLVV